MSLLASPTRCMRLNELRQAATFETLADDQLRIGTGVVAFKDGTPWACKAVGLDPDDPVAMRRHAEIVCSGFPPPDGRVTEALLRSAEASQRQPVALGFFARTVEGEFAAASGMEVTEVDLGDGEAPVRISALWGTTVLPAYRRRGIQQALIAHRLRIGLERGAELAIIESKPGIPTERNAARLGFALTYTRLTLRASAG